MRRSSSSDVPQESDLPTNPDVDLRYEHAHPERDVLRPSASAFRVSAAAGRRRTWDVLAMISAGGGLGSLARYLVAQAIPTQPGVFPWATFLANIAGCCALGALMVFVLDRWPSSRYLRPFLGIGFLGGFTTFSAFTAEIVDLVSLRAWVLAGAAAAASLIGGLAAVWGGIVLARVAVRERSASRAGATS